jgi:hypothetical protein
MHVRSTTNLWFQAFRVVSLSACRSFNATGAASRAHTSAGAGEDVPTDDPSPLQEAADFLALSE